MVTAERAAGKPDVVAVGMAGSWSHGDARMDSGVDILVLTEDKQPYIESETWIGDLGVLRGVKTEQWGPSTERWFVLHSGLEVEMGFAPPSWTATDPLDRGTRRVVEGGISILRDPQGLLARLQDACRR